MRKKIGGHRKHEVQNLPVRVFPFLQACGIGEGQGTRGKEIIMQGLFGFSGGGRSAGRLASFYQKHPCIAGLLHVPVAPHWEYYIC